ncbi:sulfatase family protein [Aureliella helgolandensis]|uniref:Arylsulfatase n=1 Tax=Aureliella helgolandensis TaxID=2527968 RepID=A0A518G825_9BACT|nr:sulfatase [Aureliella helgolandensis]QDV24732.1 Arylsulfatase [Aureliella helgolandensis]
MFWKFCVLPAMLVGCFAVGLPGGSNAQETQGAKVEKRPNILLMLCDDIRFNALGCMGHPHLKTPNIDRLASEGVLFENVFCTTSLCSPSRASILSGLYAHTHGVTNNFTEFPDSMGTFPIQLQKVGYETAYIGKYHMGENNDEPRPGFDHFVTHKGQGQYFDTEFNVDGQGGKVVPGYYTTVVTDMAEEWIQDRSGDKPWMMMIGQKAPHSFYFPEPKYEHAFDDVEIDYPHSAFDLSDKPEWIRQRLNTWHGIYGPLFDWRKDFPDTSAAAVLDFQAMVRAYMGTILSVDDSMGRLVQLLAERGELENTIVIFMGDNGLLEGEHGMVDKRTMHEPSIRIPLVMRYPGMSGGSAKRVKQQVLTVDIAPTLCELAGAEPLPKIHGRSLVQLVADKDPAWRTSWFYHYNYEKQFPYTPNVRGVRTDRWKLIRYPHGDGQADRHMGELYDLANDPDELHNLFGAPEQQERIAELSNELLELMAATGISEDTMPLDEGIKGELPDASIR